MLRSLYYLYSIKCEIFATKPKNFNFLGKGSNYHSQSNNEEFQYYMPKQTYFVYSTFFYFLIAFCLLVSFSIVGICL